MKPAGESRVKASTAGLVEPFQGGAKVIPAVDGERFLQRHSIGWSAIDGAGLAAVECVEGQPLHEGWAPDGTGVHGARP